MKSARHEQGTDDKKRSQIHPGVLKWKMSEPSCAQLQSEPRAQSLLADDGDHGSDRSVTWNK